MGKPTGFLEFDRELPRRRPVPVRLRDWKEVYEPFGKETTRNQAARCMDCGIPFCHEGCPLGNLIPEWNHLTYRGEWLDALERLHATNNFPEFTGRLCPAPCEGSCVLGINSSPVTIERVEYEIIERGFAEGWVEPLSATHETEKRIGIVGSGPAGLAAAQQLVRGGHSVTVFERSSAPGGLLRFGIPEFKMEKHVLDRRLDQLRREGVEFVCTTQVGGTTNRKGVTVRSAQSLLSEFDAVILAGGASKPRDLDVPGRNLGGVYLALEYLIPANMVQAGTLAEPPIDANGKHVIIIGGGDTGADCLGTAHRQGALSVHQLEIMPEPPEQRSAGNPWPTWPIILRTSSAHEEGGERLYSVTTTGLVDNGKGEVRALRGHQVEMVNNAGAMSFQKVEGSDFELPCDLVFLAMGFVGAETDGVVADLGVALDARGSVIADDSWQTNAANVFVCGDMTRGQSLIVWAIAEGRSAAAAVDKYLMGETALPAPIQPGQVALR